MESLCLARLVQHQRYATNRNDLVREFYWPCIGAATTYDRAVGYFSSSILLLAIQPVAEFAMREGRIRLVCSPHLDERDIEALRDGYALRDVLAGALQRDIEDALADAVRRDQARFLATLVATGCLDVRIAFRPGATGIFHDKLGLFHDQDGHIVSFTGSVNETGPAWDLRGNHESFDVFWSWGSDGERVKEHAAYFQRLWRSEEPGVETTAFPDVARDRLVAAAHSGGAAAAWAEVRRLKTGARKVPRPYQTAAVAAWEANGRRGILEHATGSGKTVTALTAMRSWLADGQPVLIVVPSELLLDQWTGEVRAELADLEPRVLVAGGGEDRWKQREIIEAYTQPEGGPRVLLATLQTASGVAFVQRVIAGPHLLIVVDEAHRAGSPVYSRVLQIQAGARLGLSATPRRFGDQDGTRRIFDYFGSVVHRFTLEDAIAAGRLCGYTYQVHPVSLHEDEQADWLALTEQIRRMLGRAPRDEQGSPVLNDVTKLLLIKRARIVKRAAAKVPAAVSVLRDRYERGQRWLVYCEDRDQLTSVLDAVRAVGIAADEYHTGMEGDRERTLRHFTAVGGVLVAIRCLDEGVDIPSVDHGLILASSKNPREFVQRRGRLLRRAEGKQYAHIHDVLVLPPVRASDDAETAIALGELGRAYQFAAHATNKSVRFRLKRLASDLGIDVEDVVEAGFEDEDEEGEK